jgi:hypothetical protein
MHPLTEPARKRFMVFAAAAGLSLALGVWGFRLAEPEADALTLVYRSFQLFSLESGAVDPPAPWPLEIARWLAPLTLLGGAIGGAMALLGANLDRLRARRLRGHHIICGLGGKGAALAADLLDRGERVVALDPRPAPDDLARFRRRGGLHLPLEVGDQGEWRAAGLRGAATFTALTPDDARNLALALDIETAAARQPAARPGRELRIFAHIGSVAYRDLLDRNAFLGATPHGPCTIRSFNAHANLARLLFDRHPLETAGHADGAVNPRRPVHLVLPGLGPEASAFLVHVARTAHFTGERQTAVRVLAPHATREVAALLAAYPGLNQCFAALEACDTGAETDFGLLAAGYIRAVPEACHTVFAGFDGAPGHLADVLRVHEAVPAGIPIRMPLATRLKPLLTPPADQQPLLASRLAWFPEPAESCGAEAVFGDRLDLQARRIHEAWFAENQRQIEAAEAAGDAARAARLRAKPTFRGWHALTEEQKDSNRSQADHLAVKTRAAGFDPATVTRATWDAWCAAHPDDLDRLAATEHARWCAHLRLAGWTAGPRDDAAKVHDNLVPYAELDENTKEYDRQACREAGCLFS